MKNIIGVFILVLLCVAPGDSFAQTIDEEYDDTLSHPLEGKMVVIKLNDNNYISGVLLSADDREYYIDTRTENGKIYVPKYKVITIEELNSKNIHKTKFRQSTAQGSPRIGLTRSGIPYKKGQQTFATHYYQAISCDFGLQDNLSASVSFIYIYALHADLMYHLKVGTDDYIAVGAGGGVVPWVLFSGSAFSGTGQIMYSKGTPEHNFSIGFQHFALPDFGSSNGNGSDFIHLPTAKFSYLRPFASESSFFMEGFYAFESRYNVAVLNVGFKIPNRRGNKWVCSLIAVGFSNRGNFFTNRNNFLVLPVPYVAYQF